MKKQAIICNLILILSLMFCGCANSTDTKKPPATDEVLLGGWEIAPHEAETLPQDAQAAFDKVKASLDDGEYTPVALM